MVYMIEKMNHANSFNFLHHSALVLNYTLISISTYIQSRIQVCGQQQGNETTTTHTHKIDSTPPIPTLPQSAHHSLYTGSLHLLGMQPMMRAALPLYASRCACWVRGRQLCCQTKMIFKISFRTPPHR